MKKTVSMLLLFMAFFANAEDSLNKIEGNMFLRALTPTIPFHAVSENKVGSKLVMVKVSHVQSFQDAEGNAMLFGGVAEVCNQYKVTGSDRICLSSETVNLVKSVDYDYSYCVSVSGDGCVKFNTIQKTYPMSYMVDVVKRSSVSDDFNYANVAYRKEIAIEPCTSCKFKSVHGVNRKTARKGRFLLLYYLRASTHSD